MGRNKLREYLRANNISGAKMADDFGISPSAVNRWLCGNRAITLRDAIRIEDYTFGQVTPRDLNEGSEK